LENACGHSLHAYAQRKEEQLETLGFDTHRFKTNLSFVGHSFEEIVSGFMGEGRLRVVDLVTTETRFGLEKQIDEAPDNEAFIEIDPHPIDTCTITVRGAPSADPAVFRANVIAPAIPDLPNEYRRVVLKNDFFDVVIRRKNWTISFKGEQEPQSPSLWIDYWRFCNVAALGVGTINVKGDKANINVTLPFDSRATNGVEPEVSAWWIPVSIASRFDQADRLEDGSGEHALIQADY
jgi:hypothetical protein